MNDFRTIIGQRLGQRPLDEEEFAKLSRLERLMYYPVPRSYFDQALRPRPGNPMQPNPQMDMPPVNQTYRSNMNDLDNKQLEADEKRKLLMQLWETEIKRKLTPEQKRWIWDNTIIQPGIRDYTDQRKKPRDI